MMKANLAVIAAAAAMQGASTEVVTPAGFDWGSLLISSIPVAVVGLGSVWAGFKVGQHRMKAVEKELDHLRRLIEKHLMQCTGGD